MLNRRHLIASAPALLALRPARATGAQTLHALNRLGYGPRPGDLEVWGGRSWDALVEQQLQPATLPLPPLLAARLEAWGERQHAQSLAQRVRAYRDAERRANEKGENARRELVQSAMLHAAEGRLARALWSPRQLEERLVEFWFNHFNVFFGKGICRVLTADYEARAIRPHVLGRFRAMLGATAKHPAMLFYLDNWLSSGQGPSGGRSAAERRTDAVSRGPAGEMPRRPQRGLNENYARELMELHTLGVDGGYTQRDVTELAKVLTGWTMNPRAMDNSKDADDEGFFFAPGRHEPGPKTWLGQAVPGRGQEQGEWVLDQLARHPATARRIAFKLAQHFVADAPEPALVQAVAEAFLKSDGDLHATTRALLLHPLARAAEPGSQFKTPYRYVLSLLRATEAPVEDWQPVLQALRGLGQPLFGCVTPDGWKCTRDAWLDPEALARRSELAARVAQRVQPAPERLLSTLGSSISERTRQAVAQQPARLQASLLLASPDFNNV